MPIGLGEFHRRVAVHGQGSDHVILFRIIHGLEQMPVLDNILVVLTKRSVWTSMFEIHKDFHLSRAEEVLKKVGLWEKRNELAKNLSYGQRKLLEIGRVLAMQNGFGDGRRAAFGRPTWRAWRWSGGWIR